MGVGALVREFEWLADRSARQVTAWAGQHPALAGCTDLAAVLAAVRLEPDPVLHALLTEVRAGCGVAARVVLQAMLPKLLLMSRSDRGAFAMDYVAQLWLRIHTYPLARRPERIAANLALDTLKAVQAERGQAVVLVDERRLEGAATTPDRGSVVHAPFPVLRSDNGRPAGDVARELLRTAVERRLVDPHTHAVLASVFADGLSEQEVARRYQVTPLTIRRRCNKGITALAEHAHELAAVL